jgi:hypothetical protein
MEVAFAEDAHNPIVGDVVAVSFAASSVTAVVGIAFGLWAYPPS